MIFDAILIKIVDYINVGLASTSPDVEGVGQL